MNTTKQLLFFCFAFFLFSSFSYATSFIYLSSEGEIIKDGEILGQGANLVVDGNNYAYETFQDGSMHIIFNGKDKGEGYRPQMNNGKLLYEKTDGLKNIVVFEGKELGEGYDPYLVDGHVVFFQVFYSENVRKSYQGSVLAYYDGKYYCDGKAEDIKEKIHVAGNNVMCQQTVSSGGTTKEFIVYNGKVIDEGYRPRVSASHYSYMKKKDFGTGTEQEILIIDGKEYPEGFDLEFSEDSFLFFIKNLEGEEEIVFNGKNFGTFTSRDDIILKDGHIAFLREVKELSRKSDGTFETLTTNHVFYDGIDRGVADKRTSKTSESKKIFLSGNHIAFERTLKGKFINSSGQEQEGDFTYAIFDGRARTTIVSGSLRMKDGYFAFAKEIDVYDDAADTGTQDSDGNPVLGKYVKTNYIYKGDPSGKITQLGEGDSNTIVVDDGKVAYSLIKEVEEQYLSNGKYFTTKVERPVIFIDGKEKRVGEISTIVFSKGNYAFAENKSGRWFLVINDKQQTYPAAASQQISSLSENQDADSDLLPKMVYFLEAKTVLGTDPDASKIVIKGTLLSRGSNLYIRLMDSKYVRVAAANGVSLDKFQKKMVYAQVKRTVQKDSKTKKQAVVYTVYALATTASDLETAVANAESSSGKITQKGTLEKSGSGYVLKVGTTKYRLILKEVKSSEIESYVGDIVSLELKKNGNYYEVYSVK